MHPSTRISSLMASIALVFAAPAFAQHNHDHAGHSHSHSHGDAAHASAGKLIKITKNTDKQTLDWAAKERAKYPLDTCVVSGEKFGSMGKPAEYVYRVEGQPDRLVVFCCSGCEEEFLANPAKHLSKLDAGAKARSGSASAQGQGDVATKPGCACCAS